MTKLAAKGLKAPRTPVRAALRSGSPLRSRVKDGLGAVIKAHHICFEESIRSSFGDSLDIDKAFEHGREQENRWDYLLGHAPTNRVVGIEPHSAENGEISTVIKKLQAARRQLQDHLREGKTVSKWIWVASGKVHFSPMEKATFQLAQSGIQFVGRKITTKHLG